MVRFATFMQLRHLFLLLAAVLAVAPLAAQTPDSLVDQGGDGSGLRAQWYTTGPASDDGTGIYYMGRQLACVMDHRSAAWMERPERERTEMPAAVVRNLELEPDDVVADIGAGTGYFTFRLAAEVPEGGLAELAAGDPRADLSRERLDEVVIEAAGIGDAGLAPGGPGL
ncbi:MAG: hypothetical protein R3284_12955, partial [Rubricoccaceae bacterium]|nr:hypothetical protein [Rubricoccaceae bacterium]